jgi:signal transduction histidine kinase
MLRNKTKKLSKNDKWFIVKSILYFIVFLFMFYIYFTFVYLYFEMKNNQINLTNFAYEYADDIDGEALCESFTCKSIMINNFLMVSTKDLGIVSATARNYEITPDNYLFFNNIIYYTPTISELKNGALNIMIEVDLSKSKIFIFEVYVTFASLMLLIFIIFLINGMTKASINMAAFKKGKEVDLANRMLGVMTDNISHEMNASITKTVSRIADLQQCLSFDYIDKDEIIKISNDIKDYMSVATGVMGVMTGVKQMRYNDTNKNIYDMVELGFRTIVVYSSDVKLSIDPAFKKLTLDHIFLNNSVLTHIFTTLFTNAIEAGATEIEIKLGSTKKNFSKIYVIDNGSGIPKDFQDKLFGADTSTKNRGSGNGLMVNREILRNADGDLTLVYTEDGVGSTFCISVHTENFKI